MKFHWNRSIGAHFFTALAFLGLSIFVAGSSDSPPSLSGNSEPGTNVFDVRKFGAAGDGRTLDTRAIQRALDACGKAGGTVVFPPGTYLSQPLTLRSKTTMQIKPGATLLADTQHNAYLKKPGDWLKAKSSGDFVSFIGGQRLVDLTVTGGGMIDGNGSAWWSQAEKARQIKPGYTLPRPNLIGLERCTNVRLENITLENSPKFHFVPADCENVLVSNVTIQAPEHAANTDAIDPSGHHILITKCKIDVGDDDVAIKAGKKQPAGQFQSEDITIADCTIRHGHGISIGSETAGGVRNVTVRNCTFENTENGLRIKSQRGKGGLVENIRYRDITMTNVNPAITLTCYYMNNSAGDTVPLEKRAGHAGTIAPSVNSPGERPSTSSTDAAQRANSRIPIYRNISISNLTATCPKGAGVIMGLPESVISNVVLENVRIWSVKGLAIKNAKGVQLKNVQLATQEGPPCILDNAQIEGLPQGAGR